VKDRIENEGAYPSLYDRYARPATNNPMITAAIFMTFLIVDNPATAPSSIG